MTVSYSTNWMGPINSEWIARHGTGWSSGRIDCRGTGLDPMYGDEIGLRPMRTADWRSLGVWLIMCSPLCRVRLRLLGQSDICCLLRHLRHLCC